MLEAVLSEGGVFKKILDAIKDLVSEANFDCNSTGISLQAMDQNHVSLVSLTLRAESFDHFRCDSNRSLGIQLSGIVKILKCADNSDAITLKAEDSADSLQFLFESKKQTRISHFSLKLIDLDSEHLGIPETDYKTIIKMPASEFQRICKELATIGDTVNISASKEGVKFAVTGEQQNGAVTLKTESGADDKEEEAVSIKLDEECSLTFALRYLNFFAKATPLADFVTLRMSSDVPLMVEYNVTVGVKDEKKDLGYIRYYLAPKIEEEGGEQQQAEPEQRTKPEKKGKKKEKGKEADSAPKVKKEVKSEEDTDMKVKDEDAETKVKEEMNEDE